MAAARTPKYRATLREVLAKHKFYGEGGAETTLVFAEKVDLPFFASFPVFLRDPALADRWQKQFFENARASGGGYWLDSKTWRANPDYGEKLGVDLEAVWRDALQLSLAFRDRHETPQTPVIVSGVVGPRRDGYVVSESVPRSIEGSKEYHLPQVSAFERHGADVVTVYTMNHFEEAAGIALACKAVGIPVVISFTVEVDGTIPSGETLASAVKRVDDASDAYPLFYMVNCAHPSHMENAFSDPLLQARVKGLFPNSSRKSHAELDESTELDRGEPDKIGLQLHALCERFGLEPVVVGGCCGTDIDHLCSIGRAFAA